MADTREGIIAGAVVLVAVMATACSESPKKADTRKTPAPAAVPTSFVPEEPAAPVATITPPAGPVSFLDGEAAYQARKYGEAAQIFERYIEQRPELAWGHFMLGLSAWKGGDLAKAEASFEEALRIDPNHVKSLVNASRVLLDQKRPEEAIEKLSHAADIDPMSSDVHRLLGRAYHGLGRTDEAVSAYTHAIDLDDRDGWSMNNLGLLFLEQGRAADAVPLFTKAVEVRHDVATFHNNLGMALEHTGRFADSAAAYNGALAADPGYDKAKRNLARVEKVKEPQEPVDRDVTPTEAVDSNPGGSLEAPQADSTPAAQEAETAAPATP